MYEMNKVLAQITMNAGDGIPGSVIKTNLRRNAKYFDKVVVVDGDLTDEAKRFYDGIPNLCVVDSPWRDSYVDQYRAWRDAVDDGDWVLYLDCDEMPSFELLEYLGGRAGRADKDIEDGTNTLCLPCVLHMTEDGKSYYAAEKDPLPTYQGQWMKNILVLKDETLDFKHFGSHVIPHHGDAEKGKYIPYPYYHMKTLESFVYNDVWQAYLHPEGQHYDPVEAKLFKLFTKVYRTTKEFKEATKKGKWSPALRKFAWDKRHQHNKPISRLSWVYFILEGHPHLDDDDFMKWKNVKAHILDEEKIGLMHRNRVEGRGITV